MPDNNDLVKWGNLQDFAVESKKYTNKVTNDIKLDVDLELQQIDNKITDLKKSLNYVTPEMFGAVGDGITDDTEAIQNALNNGNFVLFASGKTYVVSDTVFPESDSTIELNNGKIKLVRETPVRIINISGKKNVIIRNGFVEGVWKEGYESSSFMINIHSSMNIILENLDLTNNYSDGIYIGYDYWSDETVYETSNITVRNCNLHHLGRNGIALVSGINVDIDNCRFDDIVKNWPKAGIDIEPETGVNRQNLAIDKIRIRNNKFGLEEAYCIGFYLTDLPFYEGLVEISNNTFSSLVAYQSPGAAKGADVVFKDNTFLLAPQNIYRMYIRNPLNRHSMIIDGVTFHGKPTEYTDSSSWGDIEIIADAENCGNIKISNIHYVVSSENYRNYNAIRFVNTKELKNIDLGELHLDGDYRGGVMINRGAPFDWKTCNFNYTKETYINPTYYQQSISRYRDVIIEKNINDLELNIDRYTEKILHKITVQRKGVHSNFALYASGVKFADNETATKAIIPVGMIPGSIYYFVDNGLVYIYGVDGITYR